MSIARGVTLLTPGRGRGAEGAVIPERLGRQGRLRRRDRPRRGIPVPRP